MRILAITATRDVSPSPAIASQLSALERLGVEVDRLSIPSGAASSYIRAAAQVMIGALRHGRRYDVIHGFYGHCGAVARAQLGIPVVVTFQGSDLLGGTEREPLFRRDGIIGRTVARFADAVIVMTEEMKRASGRADALVLPFGVDTELFRPRDQAAARAELGLSTTGRLVLFPWHPDRPEKNHSLAAEAVRLLRDAGEDVKLLTIHGRPPREVALHMNACDALVLVSSHEGSPVAVREALACGLPVVSVDVGDVAEVIAGAHGCRLVDRAADAVAEGLRQAFRAGRSEDGAARMAKLDVAWAAKEVLRVYQGLSTKRRGTLGLLTSRDG